jgi:hypothetical protein
MGVYIGLRVDFASEPQRLHEWAKVLRLLVVVTTLWVTRKGAA